MSKKSELYPLKFHPIIKERIWGGSKLNRLLNKPKTTAFDGESWEISAVEGSVSVVSSGEFEGINLTTLIEKYKDDLVGRKVYRKFGTQFPLLIKFIDAQKDLSIQVHPNDALAMKRHNSFGKTEMWYVMQADEKTNLIVDFKEKISKKRYQKALNNEEIEDLLNYESIAKGDSYFISAGKIHAIGKGALIAEIQQSSDITYRVYDWNRKDDKGNSRELHTELALDALDFSAKKDYKIGYKEELNIFNEMASSPYFTTNFVRLNEEGSISRNYGIPDSFKILICVEGSGYIETDHYKEKITLGETLLIPATISKLDIQANKEIKLLEIYV